MFISSLLWRWSGADGFAQNATIDSLQLLIKTANPDTNKVNHLNELSKEYLKTEHSDTAIKYNNLALQLAQKLNFKQGMARAHTNIGHIYCDRGNYLSALKNYSVALKIIKENNLHQEIANAYNNIVNVYSYQANYPEALKNYFFSLKKSEEIGDKQAVSFAYSGIGIIYFYQKNYEKSLKSFFASLKIDQEIGNKEGIADSYNNIAAVYYNQKRYSEAAKIYFNSLKINQENKDKQGIAVCYNNIGGVYFAQGNYQEALKNFIASLKIKEEIGLLGGIASNLIHLGETQTKLKNYKIAQEYFNKALAISTSEQNKNDIKDSYEGLVKLDSAQGNWRDAYLHQKLFVLYKDSIDNDEIKKQTIQTAMTYEFEKKEAATKVLQEKKDAIAAEQAKIKELELSRTRHYMYGLGGLLLLAFTIGILVVRQNKLQSMQRSMQLEQKLLRLQMNPHFIYNSLSIIHEHIQSNRTEIAGDYLIKFSRLMRLILENSRQEYVSLDKEIETLNNYLKIHQLVLKNGFDFTIHIDESIDQELIAVPPMLAQPFIENALKHGIAKGDKKGEIKISFEKSTNGILFSVIDNGIGYSNAQLLKQEQQSEHNSLATQIVYERLDNINKNKSKKIHIHISDYLNDIKQIIGTKIEFEIPINYIA